MKLFRNRSTAPLWKDEFSVFTADERYVNRRQFTKFLTLTSLAMFAGNLWVMTRALLSREPAWRPMRVADAGELGIGGVKIFSYPGPQDPCILVRTTQDSFVAYSQKCTHLSCAVYYEADGKRLACPCHRGYFSVTDGGVLQGPPQRALPRVVLQRQGNDLVAIRMEGA